ncbi:hypothetical protein A2773_00850 [Candidatus Gottesmanbacteria bacterium RIFCSPHIGHO2_01_FULL_39_10]|uniref:Mannosyl-glycoprotein endo-beta-N-acetylglucosamidase-like domain-containing protein n=1 Tax=Candidatus Gottesmanbacteria bacterium RIFCSPHIGHO2_01_FULL_39_10 TaxID=1798375 RepID=A0A1F5ZLI3_9BACT|nr:MAG: hypothetical protein A2773_00850 [Candidatus Gottesmanbacteria bacterium RIFCSPHIGHO2_01_FULL_39_10]
MKKLIYFITFLTFLFIRSDTYASTGYIEADASARMEVSTLAVADQRAEVLKNYLEGFNSPLAPFASKFVSEADKYDIPWTWVPAISGIESTFGKHIPYNSYNAWGWANGEYAFKSWDEAIKIVTKTLKERYVDRGADTIDKIAPIYAPPSHTWAGKVQYFIGKIEAHENKADQLPISI